MAGTMLAYLSRRSRISTPSKSSGPSLFSRLASVVEWSQFPFIAKVVGILWLNHFFSSEQIFCTLLWLLDEYWKYAIFNIGSILVFEGSTAFGRRALFFFFFLLAFVDGYYPSINSMSGRSNNQRDRASFLELCAG